MLVTMAEILKKAKQGGYGVTAPNVQSEDTVRAVIRVAENMNAPMIVDVKDRKSTRLNSSHMA